MALFLSLFQYDEVEFIKGVTKLKLMNWPSELRRSNYESNGIVRLFSSAKN